jgi:hypothetical protein
MGGKRTPHDWRVFVGGPFDGERRIFGPGEGQGPTVTWYTSSPERPGMVVPHQYAVTPEVRKGGFHESPARALLFLRTLPEEPAPPPTPMPPSHSTPRD